MSEKNRACDNKNLSIKTRPEKFEKFLSLLPETIKNSMWLIPIVANGKEPDVPKGKSWKSEGVKLTPEDALKRLREGKNIAIVAYPHSLCFIDNDDPKNFPSATLPPTLTVKTRDGGFQYYYINVDIERNAVLKFNKKKIGELRANVQYVLAPGSYVPPSDEAFEGATGVYEITNEQQPAELSIETLPEWIKECIDGREQKKTVNIKNPRRGGYVNDLGIPLEIIRKVDEKLDELLADLNPGYPSRSEADLATASKLWWWRFTESDIANILRDFRPYEKTERDDYLELTISKVIGGERFDPQKNIATTRKLQEFGYLTEIEIPKLPQAPEGVLTERIRKYKLDKHGITAEDLLELATRTIVTRETKDGDIEVEGLKHGEFACWLREHFQFATNSVTEEIWRYDPNDGVWKNDGESFLKSLIERIMLTLGYPELVSTRRVSEVISHIKRHPQVHPSEFNKAWRDGWINVKNGVLNIFTREFRPHAPEFLFTWRINASYDPDARSEVLEYFLTSVVGDEQKELLEEIIAYCLLPGQPFKRLFVFYGPRDTGKTTTIELITNFLGRENCSAVPLQELENGRFALAEVWGKLVNAFADLPPTKLTHASRIKAITGGDELPIERKFRDMFFAKIDAKLIFSANRLPPVDESDAWWSRVVILNFRNRFPRDDGFKKKLFTEEVFSALLNICLDAIPRLLERKFETHDVENTLKTWKLASDPLAVFIEERVEIIATREDDEIDNDIYVYKNDVWNAFSTFCEVNGIENPYSDFNSFVRAFNAKIRDICGAPPYEGRKLAPDGKNRRVWFGLRLKDPDDDNSVNDNDDDSTPPNNDSPNFIDERELKEEWLKELLAEDDSEEEKGESNGSMENEEGDAVKEEDTTEKEEKDKTYKCVCGFETTDWREFDRHRAFCDEFQRLQALEAKKTMDALFGNRNGEKEEEEKGGGSNKEPQKTDASSNSPDFSMLINGDVKYVTVRILEDLPPFVGLDEKIYTLKAGEVVKIPEIHASILIRHGKAVEIKEGDFG